MNKKLNSLILMMAWCGMVAPSLWAAAAETDRPESAASDRASDETFPHLATEGDGEATSSEIDETAAPAPLFTGIQIMTDEGDSDEEEMSILPQWTPAIDDMPRVMGSIIAAPATWAGLAMLGYLLIIKRSSWLKRG